MDEQEHLCRDVDSERADPSEEEIARLGREMYQRDTRGQVEDAHHGEVVPIDVDTGNWAIGDNVIAATGRLRRKHPEPFNILSERVGYSALRHFGGRHLRRGQ